MTDLAKLADALAEKPDSDGHCREAAAILRAAAAVDVQGLMDLVKKYGHYRYASGFDYARKHSIDAQMGDSFAAEALAELETALRMALVKGEK